MSRVGRKTLFGGVGAIALASVGFVGAWEGLRTTAYIPIPGDVPTICYGETKNVRMGQKATKAECDAMLIRRLDEFGSKIEACAPALKSTSSHVYVAHLSLAYNVGSGGYCRSSVARKLQAGDVRGSCDALLLYRYAGGRVVKGLERRREAERANCLKGA